MKRPNQHYGNFSDPAGLVWRMLSDAGPVGKRAIIREVLSKGAALVDRLLEPVERRLSEHHPDPTYPLVLIVGPPRSGTTLVSQVMACWYDVTYFSNLNAMFPRSPIAAHRYTRYFQTTPVNDVRSLFGITSGLNGINDGFHVWNRFLGSDRYQPATNWSVEEQQAVADFFRQWTSLARKPFLNKNNRNLACADRLTRALPEAYFVCVTRDPVMVAQSLIKARKWVQGDARIGWGLLAETVQEGDLLAVVDSVCRQVMRNMESVEAARARIPDDHWFDINYESFCAAPYQHLRDIQQQIPGLDLRSDVSPPDLQPLQASNEITLPPDLASRIEQQLLVMSLSPREIDSELEPQVVNAP